MKKCKKLGNQATQREIKEAHRAKMEMKAARNAVIQSSYDPEPILANISVHHEFANDTVADHEARKK